jgi:hypothetical protein
MLYFRKFFKFPSPKDLGMSDNNDAMGTELFPQDDVPTWEEYYRRVKKDYPVKYFFASTLPYIFVRKYERIIDPIQKFVYWVKCHTLKSHRFHLLDLRQDCSKDELVNYDCYRYGWCDVDHKMLYALFNLLKEYLEEEPTDLTTHYSLEEINADPGYKSQYDNLQEARAIYHWWTVDRKKELTVYDEKLKEWSELHHNDTTRRNGKSAEVFKELHQVETDNDAKEEEMIARLLKIRKSLWT